MLREVIIILHWKVSRESFHVASHPVDPTEGPLKGI